MLKSLNRREHVHIYMYIYIHIYNSISLNLTNQRNFNSLFAFDATTRYEHSGSFFKAKIARFSTAFFFHFSLLQIGKTGHPIVSRRSRESVRGVIFRILRERGTRIREASAESPMEGLETIDHNTTVSTTYKKTNYI